MSEKNINSEIIRLIEAEKTDRGYEFIIGKEKYLSKIDASILAEYSEIASDVMRHIVELVEDGKVRAEDINRINGQIREEYPEMGEQEKTLLNVMRARSAGLIDDYFEKCIQELTVLKGWPVDSAAYMLLERPKVLSCILSVLDVYMKKCTEDPEYMYEAGAYWLIRTFIAGDPRTEHYGYVSGKS